MNIWKASFVCCALLAAQMVSAADVGKPDGKYRRNSYQTNKFLENLFIGVSGGVNLYQGRGDDAFPIDKRLAPAIDVYVGKWFTPWIGGRLAYSGLYAKGWSATPPYLGDGSMTDGFYNEEFSSMYFHADFMWNISNTIGGYRHSRFWNFIPYVGAGYIRLQHRCGCAYGDDIAASVGLYNTLRISRSIDITLDVRHSILGSKAVEPQGDPRFDYLSTASLGLAFKIGNNRFKRPQRVNVSQYTNRISELKSKYKKANARAAEAALALADEKAKTVRILDSIAAIPVPVIVKQAEAKAVVAPIALFFEVGKTDLGAKEIVNLNFYVENVMKADPARIFTLTGIADNSSGSKAGNEKLALKRVDYVYDLLVKEYGVNPKQLEKKGIAGENMFPDSRLNRVVIIR